MDLLNIVLNTIKKNLILFFLLIVLSIGAGAMHYYMQSFAYVSNFKTNNGFVDYPLFKSLTDFKSITNEVYDLSDEEIAEIQPILNNFKVSFVEETASSISFTAVSKNENADHKALQGHVITLINNNKFVQTSQANELMIMEKKLLFLKEKIRQLDSLMLSDSPSTYLSKIPRDSYYLYTEQMDLEDKISSTGKFELIKPVTEINTNKKPIYLFVALYLFLGLFIFLVFCKKEKKAEIT